MSHGRQTWRARAGLLAGVIAWWAGAVASAQAVEAAVSAMRSGSAELDGALGGLAGALGLLLLAWIGLAAACAAAGALLPAGSVAARATHRLAERTAPVMLRRLLALAVGAALVSAAAPTQAATAAGVRPAVTASAATVDDADPGWFRPASRSPAFQPPGAPAGTTGAVTTSSTRTTGTGTGTSTSTSTSTSHNVPSASVPLRAETPTLDPSWGMPGRLRPAVHAQGSIVVRRGDTLWDLAARHLGPSATDAEIARTWPHWFAANRAIIGPDPNLLRPGQRLIPPDPTSGGAA